MKSVRIIFALLFILVNTFLAGAQPQFQGFQSQSVPKDLLDSASGDWVFAITADGDIKTALTNNSSAISPTTGSLGISAVKVQNNIVTARIGIFTNIGRAIDTLSANFDSLGNITNRKDFGRSLLYPTSGVKLGKSFSVNGEWNFLYDEDASKFSRKIGIYYSALISTAQWKGKSSSQEILIYGFSLAPQIDLFKFQADNESINSFQLAVFMGASYRGIGGNIVQNRALLDQLLGTHKLRYLAFDPGVLIQVNNLRIALTFPVYEDDIDGFSDGQFTASIGVSGDLRFAKQKVE